MRERTNRRDRFFAVSSKVHFELLESRVLLSASASPAATIIVPTPILPTGTEPLQGVVGTPNSLDPALFDSAYGFNILNFHVGGQIIPGDGAGQTIAIVDAYGSPTIVQDAETFDAQWGIGNTDSTGQFFLTVSPLAPTVNTTPTDAGTIAGWAEEASLDVEWAHAVAPEAHVLLVEAPSPNLLDLLDANVFAAAQPGVVTVSNSWGIDNSAVFPNANFTENEPAIFDGFMVTPNGHTDSNGLQNAGVSFFAATGDTNASLEYPSTSINDIAIGGFTESVDINGNLLSTGIWSGSGGGTNPNYVTQYQVGEFALDADPQTGVWVFDSTPNENGQSGWSVVGGTSLATPAWAAYMAIIDQGLELRGIASLTTADALQGNTNTGVPGMLHLAEDTFATSEDFNTFMHALPTAYPLGGTPPPMGSPLVQIPSNHTGFGSPIATLLTNDMVGGGITHVGDALDILSFAEQPITTAAGQAIPTFTVQVDQPASATVDTTFNGPVTVSLDPLSTAGGVLSGIVTVNAVNGVATFSGLSVLKVGNFVLDASANNAMGATSASFQTVAAPAGQLVFVGEPVSTWQFGKMPELVVDVEDQFGNLSLTNNSTVTLSIQSGPAGGTITGNTNVAASSGVAAFAGLSFSAPGTYTLIATDGALTPVASTTFNIVPIPTTQRFTFNGAALSAPALQFQRIRNAPLFTSQGAPSAAQIAEVVAANNNPQQLANDSLTSAAVVRVAPATFSAASTPIGGGSADSVTAQLLDNGKSGINQLLDN